MPSGLLHPYRREVRQGEVQEYDGTTEVLVMADCVSKERRAELNRAWKKAHPGYMLEWQRRNKDRTRMWARDEREIERNLRNWHPEYKITKVVKIKEDGRAMDVGSVVYCPDNEQVYVVVGIDRDKPVLQLKNLTNLSGSVIEMPRGKVMEYPASWKNRDYYVSLAKKVAR